MATATAEKTETKTKKGGRVSTEPKGHVKSLAQSHMKGAPFVRLFLHPVEEGKGDRIINVSLKLKDGESKDNLSESTISEGITELTKRATEKYPELHGLGEEIAAKYALRTSRGPRSPRKTKEASETATVTESSNEGESDTE